MLIIYEDATNLYNAKLAMPQYAEYLGNQDAKDQLFVDCLKQPAAGYQMQVVRRHRSAGNWIYYRECHIEPDWLLIYRIENDILVLTLTDTGTHSDLF